MIQSCSGGCKFDYINIHWYGPNFNEFKSYVETVHKKFPVRRAPLRPLPACFWVGLAN